MNLRDFFYRITQRLRAFLDLEDTQNVYYIGGVDTLPPPLTAEEEQKMLKRLMEHDDEAKNTLIEHNLRLVAHVIKKYYTSTTDQDDLISIGTIGLIKAITTFNPTKNTRLATYAAKCIENAILS